MLKTLKKKIKSPIKSSNSFEDSVWKLQETDIDNYEFNSVEQFKSGQCMKFNLCSQVFWLTALAQLNPHALWYMYTSAHLVSTIIRTQIVNSYDQPYGQWHRCKTWILKKATSIEKLDESKGMRAKYSISIMTASIKFQKERWRTRGEFEVN